MAVVEYELRDGVATIALDDGKVNALSVETLRELHGALEQAARDEAVTILRGREGCFSAGFDTRTFGEGAERVVEMLTLGATLCERILSHPRPVLVACSGHALAAGAFLPLSADARIGAEGPFQIGLNEARIGLTVPWFAIELARARLAPAHFDRAVGCAHVYDPAGAVAAGFLDRLVPAEALREESLAAARSLAELDARAHHASKLRVRREQLRALREAIETELTLDGLATAQAEPAAR
ncbi:MAG TPA: crotonase/enoyl-CoA hydratase family protein [Solirubrobacteraceae bacterium]|nr:crotonase/enoyl-CoA hydratase family protein [Solirubrobacteraceae bacterium]